MIGYLFVFEIYNECKMDVDMDVDYVMNEGENGVYIYLYFVCYLQCYDVMTIV